MNSYWKNLIITSSIILLSAAGLSLYGYQLQAKDNEKTTVDPTTVTNLYNQKLMEKALVLNDLSLRADSIYIQNLSTHDVIYSKNAESALPLASLTKIMTAFVALEHLDPKTQITFSQEAIAQIGDQGFAVGEEWELHKLIPFMMTTSSNDAAYAIAETIEKTTGKKTSTLMNNTAIELEVPSLAFRNSTGLDIVEGAGTSTTSAKGNAADIAKLFLLATEKYPDIFTTSSIPNVQLGTHNGANTNILTESIPGFLASKTGYTETAQGNLAFIVEIGPNQPYIVVLLGSTFNGRFNDAKKIIATLYDVVAQSGNNL